MNMKLEIGTLKLKNPIMVASGTFGYGEEFSQLVDLNKIGAIVTKTVTIKPREGNPPPRIFETPSGMLNAIGLQNDGIEDFIKNKLPKLARTGTPVIASIYAEKAGEFGKLARILDKEKRVAAIELNLSCPNLNTHTKDAWFQLIAQDAAAVKEAVQEARCNSKKPIIAKLSPNVTQIAPIAVAAEQAGADAVSLINTFLAMSFDTKTRQPRLGNITGGLSGPAIRPIAVLMVWEAAEAVKIPVIGGGGIMDTNDALEFFIAGAAAVSVGTANFVNPQSSIEILKGIKKYLAENKIKDIKDIKWKRKTKK